MNHAQSLIASDFFNSLLGVSRLCAIVKLASNFRGQAAVPQWLAKDFFIPFVIHDLRSEEPRWSEIDEYFDVARRLAYLNRDTALVGSPVTVALSPLLSNLVDPQGLTRDALQQCKEITSAYEHTVYENFYHAPEARKATAVVAASVLAQLRGEANAAATITNWMHDHSIENVVDPTAVRERLGIANLVGAFSLRSFFCSLSGSESEIENNIEELLGSAGGAQNQPAAAVCKYVPPESIHSFEPDQVHLDAFVLNPVKTYHVGLLLKLVADDLDSPYSDLSDVLPFHVKSEAERVYESLLRRLISIAYEGLNLEIRAWPLSRLGKFKERDDERGDISIWHVSSDLNDKFTKHIVRDTSTVQPALTSIRDELRGLSQLRAGLRQAWKANRTRPRKRHFLITASVRLSRPTNSGTIEREFDGGILQLSARSGSAKLYLLETKGARTPAKSAHELEKKLKALGLRGEVARLKSRSAFAAITL